MNRMQAARVLTMPAQIDFECLIETLAEHDETFSRPDETSDSSILEIKAELQLLEASLRRSDPADPFGEESACNEALNIVEAIGRNPSFTTRQQLAEDPLPSSDESTVLPLGGVLGQYRLLQKLGEGGFGTVYKALHSRLDKIVALKVLTASRLRDPHAVDRFDREMRAVGKLHHINIVAAHDAGEIDGMHYLVMELVDGIDLSKLVKQHGRLPIGAACELIRQAAVGLQHVHEHGLVHRDIKPSNLMLTLPQNHDDAPAVKLLDLGLALLDESHLEHVGELTATGQVMGTLEYMAPEQGSDTHTVDIRADIYSLGATLYKLLTGRAPFSSDQYRTPMKLLMALATQDPPPLTDRCAEISPELEAIVRRMLAKNPDDRYSTPRELAEALAPFSHPADVQALVEFLAKAADEEVIDVNAPEFIGTLSTSRLGSPVSVASDAGHSTRRPAGRWRPAKLALAIMACGMLVAAAIYVIQIQTPRGELIVQSDYAGIIVKVKRDGLEVDHGWSLLKGKDNKQLIRTGQIEIELPAELTGEYTVTPNRVTLTRERQEIVRIERKATPATPIGERELPHRTPPTEFSNAPKPDDPANSVDRDRVAAQHWISRGGGGKVVLKSNGKTLSISRDTRLPVVPFEFRAASDSIPDMVSEDLEPLIGLTGLQSVVVEGSMVDARAIRFMSKIPNLRKIRFTNNQIWTSELGELRELSFLHEIHIGYRQVDDDWKFIRELSHLRSLEIAKYTEPSMADFQKWSEFPQLRSIRLDCSITEAMSVKVQERNPRCRVVGRWVDPDSKNGDPPRTNRIYGAIGIDPIRTAAKVLLPLGFRFSTADRWDSSHELTLAYAKDLRSIDAFNVYTVLVPQHVPFREQDLSVLAHFSFIRLNAAHLPQADIFAKVLPLSLAVEEINFSNSDLTDEGLRHIQRIESFPMLNVQGTRVTRTGIESFKRARPACQLISNFSPPSVAAAPEELPSATPQNPVLADRERAAAELWQQRLGSGATNVNLQGEPTFFEPFSKLPDQPFYLTEATGRNVKFLTISDLKHFVNLTALRAFSPGGEDIGVRAIPYLKQMKALTRLDLTNSRIPSSAVAELRFIPHLTNLAIAGDMVDDDWKFLDQIKVYRLFLSRCQPMSKDWQRLQEVSHLRLIEFQDDVDIDAAALAEFQRRNPLCQVKLSQPEPRVVGVDPVREAVRQLAAGNSGFNIIFPGVLGPITQKLLDDPAPFETHIILFNLSNEDPTLAPDALSPLRATPFAELQLRSRGASVDKLLAAMPDGLVGRRVNICDCNLTDQGLLTLSRISRPNTLILYNTQVTGTGINAFRKAHPDCLLIGNFPTSSTVAAPADRERAAAELWQQRLGRGVLMYAEQANTVSFDPFSKLPDKPFHLCFAQGEGLKELTNADLEQLTNLADFKSLCAWGDKIDAGAIPYIKQMPTLIGLDLSRSRIPSSAVAELSDLPHLSNLVLSGEMIDDQWRFLRQLKSPYRLTLTKFQPTATDWQRLQEVPQLRVLHFHDDIDVDPVALAELQRRNPLCQVLVGYPKRRSVGVDPMREAVRELASRNIGLQIRVDPAMSRGSTVQEVLDNPSPFYVDILEIRLPKDHPTVNPELFKPLRAITYNELQFRSENVSADDFVAALPDDLRGQCLNFSDTDLTDQGLLRLSRISRPIRLIVNNTKVTREGINAYRKADPHCRIWNSL